MEFTFEYKNGEVKVYHGKGNKKEEVELDNLGWKTSYQFEFIARRVYEAFKKSMDILSREHGYNGEIQGLEGELILNLKSPFSEEFIKTLLKEKQEKIRLAQKY